MKRPEILAPAGSMEALCAALRSGADAVYAGGKLFSARSSASNFTREELAEAVRLCHLCGAKLDLAVNTIISDGEADDFRRRLHRSGLGLRGTHPPLRSGRCSPCLYADVGTYRRRCAFTQ